MFRMHCPTSAPEPHFKVYHREGKSWIRFIAGGRILKYQLNRDRIQRLRAIQRKTTDVRNDNRVVLVQRELLTWNKLIKYRGTRSHP